MADLAPGALRQGLRHAAGSIGAAVQATSGAAAAAARLNLLYEGYSGKEIVHVHVHVHVEQAHTSSKPQGN